MTENSMEVDEREEIIKKRRNRLKISIGVIAVVLLVIVMLYTFVRSHYKLPNEIDDLNNNIDLLFKFNMPMSEYDIDEEWIASVGEYGVDFCINKDWYGFSGILDTSFICKFNYYYTSNTEVTLFQFNVGDSIEKVDKQLRKHSYRCENIEREYVIYKRGRIVIELYTELIEGNKNVNNEEDIRNRVVVGYSIHLESTEEIQNGYIF